MHEVAGFSIPLPEPARDGHLQIPFRATHETIKAFGKRGITVLGHVSPAIFVCITE